VVLTDCHRVSSSFGEPNNRVFDVVLEGGEEILKNIDIVRDAGQPNKAIKVSVLVPVMDNFLTIDFKKTNPEVNEPKVSGIEVRRKGEHFSHAVIGGPYKAVDIDGDGFGLVQVDASQSHTHGPTSVLTAYTWRVGNQIVGSGRTATLNLPVGEHELTLTIVDSTDSISSDTTTVSVQLKGFPELFAVSPTSGGIAGGTVVTLTGQDIGTATAVKFGRVSIPSSGITAINNGTISVVSPAPGIGIPVKVSVVTPIGESNQVTFTFVSSTPIDFSISKITNFVKPTAVAFGPDGKLYVATQDGTLSRITLNDSYDTILGSVTSTIDPARCILGIAFDPMETAALGVNLGVYISSSLIYHGEYRSSSGNAINGKVQKVHGPNLEFVTNIITGLPISEIDHSVRRTFMACFVKRIETVHATHDLPFAICNLPFAICRSMASTLVRLLRVSCKRNAELMLDSHISIFDAGDHGELYVPIGSNTNAGFPGGIMGSGRQLENYFSAAVLIANMGNAAFNGFITYDAPNNGNPITGFGPNGVEVFAAGTRNPFGVTLHTNGKVYATDNGPNAAYGPAALNCTAQGLGVTESDKLLLLQRGGYYGHPNHKRAETDPRQCIWRSPSLPSQNGYTAPLMKVQSSTCGIIEFESDHFNGQMRGDLILSKYNSELYRVILSPDGTAVNPYTDPAVPLAGNGGLAVTQAPDGSLIDARHTEGSCYIYKPVEAASSMMDIKSVFPRRGGLAGGSQLMIFGVNFGGLRNVTIGGSACSNATLVSPTKITCILPPGTVGRKDVTVSTSSASDTFVKGYRYITGRPA
jgi:IPT/TIG domain/Malectin domain/Glucose / Sorbosone dehydrogenase